MKFFGYKIEKENKTESHIYRNLSVLCVVAFGALFISTLYIKKTKNDPTYFSRKFSVGSKAQAEVMPQLELKTVTNRPAVNSKQNYETKKFTNKVIFE